MNNLNNNDIVNIVVIKLLDKVKCNSIKNFTSHLKIKKLLVE